MMKKAILKGASVLLLGLLAVSCNEENTIGGKGIGYIVPTISLDSELISATSESRAGGDITVDDLSLTITKTDGSFKQTWRRISDFDATRQFSLGEYLIEAHYGDKNFEGYDSPAFYGSQKVIVEDNQTTPVAFCATAANSMIGVSYSEAFKMYFTDYSATFITTLQSITCPPEEPRPIHVAPGSISLQINVTKPSGTSATFKVATLNVEAGYNYRINVDLTEGGAGETGITITFDDNLNTEYVTLDLSEDILDQPEPTMEAAGFTSGTPVDIIESIFDGNLKMNVVAMAGLGTLELTTESEWLLANGWPAKIDLLATPQQTIETMQSLGFKTFGVWNNPDRMASLDFSELVNKIQVVNGTNNTAVFTLEVTDRISRVCNPLQLRVNIEDLVFTLQPQGSDIYAAGEKINLLINFNGPNLEQNLTLQYKEPTGKYAPLEIEKIVSAGAAGSHIVTITAPDINGQLEISATCGRANNTTVMRPAPIEITASDNDAFATYALAEVKGLDGFNVNLNSTSIQVRANGNTEYTNATATLVNGSYFKITGLQPSTNYSIRAAFDGLYSPAVRITTEADEPLTNTGFDEWSAEQTGDYQYLWSTPGNWGTLNALTTSESGSGSATGLNTRGCSYKSTSGTIPANSRSTHSTTKSNWLGTENRADGHTTGDALLHNDKQHSGANAALIRTVGWGSGNSAHSGTAFNLKDDAGFATCNNKTPGELYLGKYDNGAVYGIDFTSRPDAVTFYYHYDVVTKGNGDYGTAEAIVYSADGTVLASKKINLTEQGSYKQETIQLTYPLGCDKAAKLSIVFRSSELPAAITEDKKFWRTPGSNNTSGGEYVGSELYIDDIELIY